MVDHAARATLYLDHTDGWLAAQTGLVNGRSRSVVPVLVQRQGLADHLARLLDKLGLDRVPRRLTSLNEYLAEKYAEPPITGSVAEIPNPERHRLAGPVASIPGRARPDRQQSQTRPSEAYAPRCRRAVRGGL